MKNLDVVFFGNPKFSTGSLKALIDHPQVNIKCVITGSDKKVGRGQKTRATEVATFAQDQGLEIFKSDNINQSTDFLESLGNVDLYLVVAFSQFLSKQLLSIPTLGCFNLHTSLLPKYRGAAPIQYAILNGDTTTGVCIQKMVSKMDAGDVVYQKGVAIESSDTSQTLFNKLEQECIPAITAFIDSIINENISYTKQNEDDVSFAPTIKKTDGMLTFMDQTSKQIINKVRAFTPWPGTYTFINDMRLKVIEVSEEDSQIPPGTIDISFNSLLVGTTHGAVRLNKVQLEGKKPIKDFEFINGQKRKFSTFSLTPPKDHP